MKEVYGQWCRSGKKLKKRLIGVLHYTKIIIDPSNACVSIESIKKIPKKRIAKKSQKAGKDLFNQLVKLTGLPGQTIKRELSAILERKNVNLNHLTLEELRSVVATYLRQIMGGLLDRYSHRRHEH